jgi:hypothetical protein
MKALTTGFAVAAIIFLNAACPGPTVPSVPLEELLSAPERVTVGGRSFTLETFLWRDFMPGENSGGSDLMAVVLITADDLQPFPADLDSDRLWVIHGSEVWETGYSRESGPPDQAHIHQLQQRAGGGPKWETGIKVEVVVRLLGPGGRGYLLRASGQMISRTV